MNRLDLENKIIKIDFVRSDLPEAKEELKRQIKAASTEDLEYYLKEYNEYLRFINAVESLSLKNKQEGTK